MSTPDLELTHPSDIAALLDELVAAGVSLQLEPPGGGLLSLAPLVHEPGQALILRLPTLQAPPSWLLNGAVHAHAQLARVRIDFDLGERRLADLNGRPVLRLALPQRMRRHQRRQAFRVQPLSAHHPRVQWGDLRLALQDLSAGGLAIHWPADTPPPAVDQTLDGVRLELNREQRLVVQLRVQHVQQGDQGETIVGCALTQLPPLGERMLQQHLNMMQRRQRTLAG